MDNGADYLLGEITKALSYVRMEYDMSYATAVGCLDIAKDDLLRELLEYDKEEPGDD